MVMPIYVYVQIFKDLKTHTNPYKINATRIIYVVACNLVAPPMGATIKVETKSERVRMFITFNSAENYRISIYNTNLHAIMFLSRMCDVRALAR